MSRIPDLGEKYKNLPNVLEQYENELLNADDNLRLKGKTIQVANRENPTWKSYYDQRKAELKTLVEYLEVQVKRVRGRLYRQYNEKYSRELDHRAIEKYIDNEDAVLRTTEVLLEVKELYEKYQSIVEAFTARGYALNNITKLRVASLEDGEL